MRTDRKYAPSATAEANAAEGALERFAGRPVGVDEAFCPYPAHRRTDWRAPGGKWHCGVCHPPTQARAESGQIELATGDRR